MATWDDTMAVNLRAPYALAVGAKARMAAGAASPDDAVVDFGLAQLRARRAARAAPRAQKMNFLLVPTYVNGRKCSIARWGGKGRAASVDDDGTPPLCMAVRGGGARVQGGVRRDARARRREPRRGAARAGKRGRRLRRRRAHTSSR